MKYQIKMDEVTSLGYPSEYEIEADTVEVTENVVAFSRRINGVPQLIFLVPHRKILGVKLLEEK